MTIPKDSIKGLFLENPENIFAEPNLDYRASEIERIIDRFDRVSKPRPVHKCILNLLRATADFNYATVQDGFFSELRNLTKTDQELKAVFDHIETALQKVLQMQKDFSEEDQKIISNALQYCKKSIKQQVSALPSEDKLIRFWQESQLKKMLDEKD